jgi:hypothetical protein
MKILIGIIFVLLSLTFLFCAAYFIPGSEGGVYLYIIGSLTGIIYLAWKRPVAVIFAFLFFMFAFSLAISIEYRFHGLMPYYALAGGLGMIYMAWTKQLASIDENQ